MKSILVILFCILFYSSSAQVNLQLSTRVTTSIQFHQSILHVDIGSSDVIVQPVTSADSILLLKASRPDFSSTNLTVVTRDGSLHVFRLDYADAPLQWSYSVASADYRHPRAIARDLLSREQWMHGVKGRSADIRARLQSIYLYEAFMYLVFQVDNKGAFDYAIDGIRVYQRDRVRMRRVAAQEQLLTPSFLHGDTSLIKGLSEGNFVIVLPRQTLPSTQQLVIEVSEQKGGRHLTLRLRPSQLLQAKLY